MSYQCALIFKKLGLEPKELEHYENDLATEFDVELFIECVNEERELTSNSIFFEKIRAHEAEMAKRDLVIDPGETWKNWFKRTAKFEEPPMVNRHDIPYEKQPHKKIFNKIENMLNGINPYPPGHKYNKARTMPVKHESPNAEKYKIENTEEDNHDVERFNLEEDLKD